MASQLKHFDTFDKPCKVKLNAPDAQTTSNKMILLPAASRYVAAERS